MAPAKKKTGATSPAPKKTPAPQAYRNLVIVTDFNCDISNAQMEMRFRNVLAWTQEESIKRTLMPQEIPLPPTAIEAAPPAVVHVTDVPYGNIDHAAHALYACYRALGRSRPNIFIHVTDPGVGRENNRSILVTDYGNTFIGPNNGSLGLMKAYFEERDIPSTLWQLDQDKIEELEQHRMEEPTYHIPRTFHGRDIFAVTAGLLAGGVPPASLAQDKKSKGPTQTSYAQHLQPLPLQMKQPVRAHAFRDNTYGNLKTSLLLDALSFDQLVEENAHFRVSAPASGPWWRFKTRTTIFPARQVFADLPAGAPLLYLGSTFAPEWDQRLVELAINMGNASMTLGLPRSFSGAQSLIIERIR
jgi:S-adenosylmethionine hydrolase